MLTRREILKSVFGLGLATAFQCANAAAQTDGDPSAWVVELMNSVLDDIRKDPELIKAEPHRIHAFVDSRILPYADFARMTRTAVGPQWRQASAEQRQALQSGFKELLTRVYSGAFSAVKDYRAELVPSRGPAGDTPIIKTQLVSKVEKPVSVGYRMKREGELWKIIDVNVSGIWLVQNYHSQFGSILANGGIPALVQSLSDKNSSLNRNAK